MPPPDRSDPLAYAAHLHAQGYSWTSIADSVKLDLAELRRRIDADPAWRDRLRRGQHDLLDEMFVESVKLLREEMKWPTSWQKVKTAEIVLRAWCTAFRHRLLGRRRAGQLRRRRPGRRAARAGR
jgi:hypothetical protein